MDVVASGRLLPSAETVVSYRNTVIRPGTDSRHAALQEEPIGTRSGFSRSQIFVPQRETALVFNDWLVVVCV